MRARGCHPEPSMVREEVAISHFFMHVLAAVVQPSDERPWKRSIVSGRSPARGASGGCSSAGAAIAATGTAAMTAEAMHDRSNAVGHGRSIGRRRRSKRACREPLLQQGGELFAGKECRRCEAVTQEVMDQGLGRGMKGCWNSLHGRRGASGAGVEGWCECGRREDEGDGWQKESGSRRGRRRGPPRWRGWAGHWSGRGVCVPPRWSG